MRGTREVLASLFRINSIMIQAMQEIMKDLNLSLHQLWILVALAEIGPMPIRELTKRTESAYSTVSGMVSRLEEVGLVSRHRSELDHRIINVYPSQRFLEMYYGEWDGVSSWLKRTLETATPQERHNIEEGLKYLEKALSRWNGR